MGIGIQVPNEVYDIRGEAQIIHDLQEFVMADGIKGTAKINIQDIEILFGEGCIFYTMDEVHKLSMCVSALSETLLRSAEYVVAFGIIRENPC